MAKGGGPRSEKKKSQIECGGTGCTACRQPVTCDKRGNVKNCQGGATRERRVLFRSRIDNGTYRRCSPI